MNNSSQNIVSYGPAGIDMNRKPLSGKRIMSPGQLLVAAAATLAPVLIYGFVFHEGLSSVSSDWSNFGGYVAGTSGVAIGALGLYALVWTIRLQQLQIERLAQESELDDFEDRLDRLLQTLGEVLKETNIRKTSTGAVVAQGRDAFKSLYRNRLRRIYGPYQRGDFLVDDRTAVRQAFDELYRRFGSDFGHYFRTLYHCVLLVHRQGSLSRDEKQQYLDLIFCRMSKFELALLFYNCLGSNGERKFKKLIEEYGLLEHLDKSLLLSETHLQFYDFGAGLG